MPSQAKQENISSGTHELRGLAHKQPAAQHRMLQCLVQRKQQLWEVVPADRDDRREKRSYSQAVTAVCCKGGSGREARSGGSICSLGMSKLSQLH